jgi:5-(carboxyamino)imidazole ribonucleotide synthase
VETELELLEAAEKLSYPLVLKARRHGYDGKGTWVIADEIELRSAWESMHQVPAIAEAFIPFERELAVIAARSESGEITIYPVVETLQTNQVCRRTIAPARVNSTISKKVETIAQKIVTTLDAIGIFGIEFFLTAEGEVSVNEIAPRTHNSGHYTIEGCQTSQFDQLLRVVSGMQLGSVSMVAPVAVMVNLLGFEKTLGVDADYLEKRKVIASFPNTHIHWYGKKSSSVGRKLGHVTILSETHDMAIDISDRIESIWYSN